MGAPAISLSLFSWYLEKRPCTDTSRWELDHNGDDSGIWSEETTKQNEQMRRSKQKNRRATSSRVCSGDTCREGQVTDGLLRSGDPGSSPRIVQAVAPWKLCLLFQEFAVGTLVSYLHGKQYQRLLQAMGPPRGTGGFLWLIMITSAFLLISMCSQASPICWLASHFLCMCNLWFISPWYWLFFHEPLCPPRAVLICG